MLDKIKKALDQIRVERVVAVFVFIVIVGFFISFNFQNQTTGFAVKNDGCEDGTKDKECSIEKPLYCDSGKLIEDCEACGCVLGQSCEYTENKMQCIIAE